MRAFLIILTLAADFALAAFALDSLEDRSAVIGASVMALANLASMIVVLGGPSWRSGDGAERNRGSSRDIFASHAAQGLLAAFPATHPSGPNPDRIAEEAYAVADAMLRARAGDPQ